MVGYYSFGISIVRPAVVYGAYYTAEDAEDELRVLAVNPTHNTVNPTSGGTTVIPHFTFKIAYFCKLKNRA